MKHTVEQFYQAIVELVVTKESLITACDGEVSVIYTGQLDDELRKINPQWFNHYMFEGSETLGENNLENH